MFENKKIFVRFLSTALLYLCINLISCSGGSSFTNDDFHPSVEGGAIITISETQGGNYGFVYVGGTSDKTLYLKNRRGTTATNLSGSFASSKYAFKDGSFPGTGGTCTDTLAGGATCTVVVVFSPESTDSVSTEIRLNFISNGRSRNSSYILQGEGMRGEAGTVDTQTFSDSGVVLH